MKLGDYLAARGITPAEFSRQSGIPNQTVYRLIGKKPGGVQMRTARMIVDATGGAVGFDDLPAPRKRRKRRPAPRRPVGRSDDARAAT